MSNQARQGGIRGWLARAGGRTASDPAAEAERGYREQMADLKLGDTTSPRARYILQQHRAILRDTPFNRGVLAATADYIRAQEPESAAELEAEP